MKLAINFSDGIIVGSKKIDPDIYNFIRSSGKPSLDYQPEETYIDEYNKFYDVLLEG